MDVSQLRFGRLYVNPQAHWVKDHPFPEHQIRGIGEARRFAVRLLDALDIDLHVKGNSNVGDSFTITHRGKPVIDMTKEVTFDPTQANLLLDTAIEEARKFAEGNKGNQVQLSLPIVNDDNYQFVLGEAGPWSESRPTTTSEVVSASA